MEKRPQQHAEDGDNDAAGGPPQFLKTGPTTFAREKVRVYAFRNSVHALIRSCLVDLQVANPPLDAP
jgi:hypothetical protein